MMAALGNSTTAERLRGGSRDADVGNTSNLYLRVTKTDWRLFEVSIPHPSSPAPRDMPFAAIWL